MSGETAHLLSASSSLLQRRAQQQHQTVQMTENFNDVMPVEDGAERHGKSLMSQRQSSYGATSPAKYFQEVQPVALSWHGLSVVHAKSGRKILDNVSGMADASQLVALMGASGAGKTTLLNTLLCRNLKNLSVEGQVLVNGHNLGKSITYVSGYVQQDELFMGTLTVKEHLMAQARLRMVGHTQRTMRRRVNEIIDELGLQECKHARIGFSGVKKGISGGEARRLLFASELLNNPQIIFADEPTTGLDSSMADSVISVMRALTRSGRTIICTIHQPSSEIYRKFDRVMFLAQGRLAYFGEPTKATELFGRSGNPCPSNYNPADHIIQCLSIEMGREDECKQRIRNTCTEWERCAESAVFREEVERRRRCVREKPTPRKTASCWVQTHSLLKRSLLDNWRNPSLTRAKLIQKCIMGVFIGLLYMNTSVYNKVGRDNLNGAMFYIIGELTYSTLFGVLTFFPADFALVAREYHDGLYCSGAYFVARSVSYIPLFTVDGAVMVSVSYWLIGLVPTVWHFLITLGICFLVEQSAVAFGVMLSAVSPSYPVAVSVAGPILTILSLTGGLFANVGELPYFISWVQYLSWFRYGFEAFAIAQWSGAFGDDVTRLRSELSKFSFRPEAFYTDLASMALFIGLFYLVGFFGLLIRVRRAR
uniref:ABC transporter domain-containing protein n=1 Tax=Globodera rostochiensis TaxID=31243 RepID=A0A914IBY9_GLORO